MVPSEDLATTSWLLKAAGSKRRNQEDVNVAIIAYSMQTEKPLAHILLKYMPFRHL